MQLDNVVGLHVYIISDAYAVFSFSGSLGVGGGYLGGFLWWSYGWVNIIKIILSQSVYLLTLSLGKATPSKQLTSTERTGSHHTDNCPSWISESERIAQKYTMINLHKNHKACWDKNALDLDKQPDGLPTLFWSLAKNAEWCLIFQWTVWNHGGEREILIASIQSTLNVGKIW